MPISITPLGAGQDIGRSCILVRFTRPLSSPADSQAKRVALDASEQPEAVVMLDCGFHVGDDAQPFPDFERGLGPSKRLDACVITHYHIDHVGALPMLTERFKYKGPIFMTEPTKALSVMMIEETLLEGRRSSISFSREEIAHSVSKCHVIDCRETVRVDSSSLGPIEITAFRAGHVLGAVMFHVSCNGESVLYTGDFNATPDRTLGAADSLPLAPPLNRKLDVLITESTYGGTTRGSQRSQELEFLTIVNDTIQRGGKVLIPTFSLGRVQEICSCLESHWARVGLTVPIVLQTRNAKKVTDIHQEYADWGLSRTELGKNSGLAEAPAGNEFRYVRIGEPTTAELHEAGPVVLLATSAMLVGGLSVRAFKLWAGSDKNCVIFPGHCVKGTLGNRLLSIAKFPAMLQMDPGQLQVRCRVFTAPFSAHTDAKGILRTVHQTKPRNVVLVHGVLPQMESLKRRIEKELPGCVVKHPENFQVVNIGGGHAHENLIEPNVDSVRIDFVVLGTRKWTETSGQFANRIKEVFSDRVLVRRGVGDAALSINTVVPNDGSTVEISLNKNGLVESKFTREGDFERAKEWLKEIEKITEPVC